ncbi:MAG: MFS transporter, partial [Burkholderiales bacterium]
MPAWPTPRANPPVTGLSVVTQDASSDEDAPARSKASRPATEVRGPSKPASATSAPGPSESASSPWACAPYRLLLGAWLGANVCMTMHEATSAWLMASLGASAVLVALLQSAASLPSVLLALPSGALTDLTDRRRILIAVHALMSAVGIVLAVLLFAGLASPGILLAGSFAMGMTFALRLPAHSALVQEVLPRAALP